MQSPCANNAGAFIFVLTKTYKNIREKNFPFYEVNSVSKKHIFPSFLEVVLC